MTRTAAPLVRSDPQASANGGSPSRPLGPRLGRRTVHRLRVHALLEAGLRGRLTLISAPPGAGKTSALLSWLESLHERDRVAWITLGELDDNPLVFWDRVATAVARARSEPAPLAGSTEAALVASLFAALQDDEPLLLVLDDFQLIRSKDVLAPFTRLLGVAPDQLRLVVASRSDPDLELHRLPRARGTRETGGVDTRLPAQDGPLPPHLRPSGRRDHARERRGAHARRPRATQRLHRARGRESLVPLSHALRGAAARRGGVQPRRRAQDRASRRRDLARRERSRARGAPARGGRRGRRSRRRADRVALGAGRGRAAARGGDTARRAHSARGAARKCAAQPARRVAARGE